MLAVCPKQSFFLIPTPSPVASSLFYMPPRGRVPLSPSPAAPARAATLSTDASVPVSSQIMTAAPQDAAQSEHISIRTLNSFKTGHIPNRGVLASFGTIYAPHRRFLPPPHPQIHLSFEWQLLPPGALSTSRFFVVNAGCGRMLGRALSCSRAAN